MCLVGLLLLCLGWLCCLARLGLVRLGSVGDADGVACGVAAGAGGLAGCVGEVVCVAGVADVYVVVYVVVVCCCVFV